MFNLIFYQKSNGRAPVQEFMNDLLKKHKENEFSQMVSAFDKIKEYGPEVNSVYHNLIKHLRDDIWELRPGRNRVLFFYWRGNDIVFLHSFQKTSQKTPLNEIEKAIREKKDYIKQNDVAEVKRK